MLTVKVVIGCWSSCVPEKICWGINVNFQLKVSALNQPSFVCQNTDYEVEDCDYRNKAERIENVIRHFFLQLFYFSTMY